MLIFATIPCHTDELVDIDPMVEPLRCEFACYHQHFRCETRKDLYEHYRIWHPQPPYGGGVQAGPYQTSESMEVGTPGWDSDRIWQNEGFYVRRVA